MAPAGRHKTNAKRDRPDRAVSPFGVRTLVKFADGPFANWRALNGSHPSLPFRNLVNPQDAAQNTNAM